MRALVKECPAPGFTLREVPVPAPGDRDVLIRVKMASICGSDVKFYKWPRPWADRVTGRLPLVMGHECAGEIVEVGKDVRGLAVGQRVAVETHVPCGECDQCLRGRGHTCRSVYLFGHHIDGAFAEFARVPRAAVRVLPDEISWKSGALLEPASIAGRIASQVTDPDRPIFVSGCGPIGLFSLMMLRHVGSGELIAADPSAYRRKIAEELGATRVLDPLAVDVVEALRDFTSEKGAPTVIEATGIPEAVAAAFEILEPGGTLFYVGVHPEPYPFDFTRFIMSKEAVVRGIWGREIFSSWEWTERAIIEGVDLERVITHELPMSQFEEGIRLAAQGLSGKILLDPSA